MEYFTNLKPSPFPIWANDLGDTHKFAGKTQVTETTKKKPVAKVSYTGLHCKPMAKLNKRPKPIQIRPNDSDAAIIQAGMKKHGLDQVQIIRMALRRLAEADNLKVTG